MRLLAIDIDGTLVNSRDELTEATRHALRRASAAGIKIVLATGRRYSRALPLVEPLGLDAPLVTASGALIKHPLDHRTLFQAAFERSLLCEALTIVERAGFEAVLYADSYAEGFDFYCERLEAARPELADYLALNPGCHRLWPRLSACPPEGVFAGFAMGSRQEMLALHHELQRHLPGALYTHVLRSPRYLGYMCEIAPWGVTKWSGIQQLAAEWGIAPEEMCAVGDDVNDIPMIEGAGIGIAMGNALPEVKAAADWLAPTHDEDGLAAVVDWLLGRDAGGD
ncbi:MAG TPA: Cof-type HAD-IIB family hydrolase, partial [Pirellulales bacterium]|nr:Cof-type HAD-IIB family hydrolase [Pirellulales bacterium]